MEQPEKKDNAISKAKKYNNLSLIYDEFAIEHVVNAIQESYTQAGVSNRDVEK